MNDPTTTSIGKCCARKIRENPTNEAKISKKRVADFEGTKEVNR
jgi:hypothetical protein